MLLLAFLLTAIVGCAAAVAWGGPKDIPPLASINNPFRDVDYSKVPKVQRYTARDETSLAWYGYTPAPSATTAPARRVVLVHGVCRGSTGHAGTW